MKGQKTGGRKKGSINKIKPPQDVIRKVEAEAVANCIATGESPLSYMLRVMRDPTVADPRRDEMARAAAPYVHAKISPENTKTTDNLHITLAQLVDANWILPRSHSPARAMLDNVFVQSQLRSPAPTVETGDLALTRELLLRTDMIAALSAQHWEHERQSGHLVALDLALPTTRREIGFTFRADTLPSPAMQCAVNAIREVVNLRMPLANHV